MLSYRLSDSSGAGTARLRQRGLAEILDQAFRLYRRHFLTLLTITAVSYVPVQVLFLLIDVTLLGGYGNLLTIYLQDFLSYFSLTALAVAVMAYLKGEPVGFIRSYRGVLKHIGPLLGLIGLQILFWLTTFLPAVLSSLITVLGGTGVAIDTAATIGLFIMAVLILPYFYVYVRFQVAAPALIIERLGPVQALERSWQLVRFSWWRTFRLILLLNLLTFAVLIGPLVVVILIIQMVIQADAATETLLIAIVSAMFSMILAPVQMLATILYYIDLRVRKESFDIETAIVGRYANQGVPETIVVVQGPAEVPQVNSPLGNLE